MKYVLSLFIAVFMLGEDVRGQDYIFHYNPYSGYNADQLDLALEQSKRKKRNGIIATGVGTGMLIGGSVMMLDALYPSVDEPFNAATFGIGIGLMSFSGFPLGYGFVSWIMGNEAINLIEIELLASGERKLKLKPTWDGYGLVFNF